MRPGNPVPFSWSYTTDAPPADADGNPQHRTLRARLTLPEVGRPPFPVAILVHGYTGFMDWGFFPVLSRELALAGVASVRFNFSGSGIGPDLVTMTEPDVFRRNSYLHELGDLREVHDKVHGGAWPQLDAAHCSIVGHSRGGAMSLVHASETNDYRTVVTWAAIDRILNFSTERLDLWRRQGFLDVMHWTARRRLPLDVATLHAAESHVGRLDVLAACRRLVCPVLVVMGDRDPGVPFAAAESLAAACGSRGRLLRIAGGDHTFGATHPFREPLPETLHLALRKTVSHVLGS